MKITRGFFMPHPAAQVQGTPEDPIGGNDGTNARNTLQISLPTPMTRPVIRQFGLFRKPWRRAFLWLRMPRRRV
jgi:hypothetical protein